MYFVSPSKPSLVAQMVKNLPAIQKTWIQSLGWEDPLEKEMVTHSSILTWKTPWTEELGRLQSMGSQRVRPDWETSTFTFNAKWQKHLPLQALPSLMELTVPKFSGWCQGICSHSWWLSTLHGSDERRGRKRKKIMYWNLSRHKGNLAAVRRCKHFCYEPGIAKGQIVIMNIKIFTFSRKQWRREWQQNLSPGIDKLLSTSILSFKWMGLLMQRVIF